MGQWFKLFQFKGVLTFNSWSNGAIAAINFLQGRNIYDSCCRLDIELYNNSGLTNFVEKKQATAISSEVKCNDNLLEPSPVQGVVLGLSLVAKEVESNKAQVFDEMSHQEDEVQDDELISYTGLEDLSNGLIDLLKDEIFVIAFDEPIQYGVRGFV
ncbi:hypothetical protein GQ457_01G012940 [Hibiscus cannabinus]